jgi:hypothetical protein
MYRTFCNAAAMAEPQDPSDRLKQAREQAGFKHATDAARAFGWNEITYRAHETGGRGLRKDAAERYARAFRRPVEWLLWGKGKPIEPAQPRLVPLVGYVGAGAEAHFTPAGDLGEVEAPAGSTEHTVAVEIRGESLGSFFDHWLVFYDDVRRPLTADLIGRLCVVGLEDGRVLVKKPQRSRTRGLYHLLSQTEAPIMDVAVEWAARVTAMVPR